MRNPPTRTISRLTETSALLLLAAALPACGSVGGGVGAASSDGGALASSPGFRGEWRIRSHSCPTTCELSASEANRWVGSRAEFTTADAIFGEELCERPAYGPETLSRNAFADRFGVAPTSLSIEGDRILTVSVGCRIGEWSAPVQTLVVRSSSSMFAVAGGVFFLLERTNG